MAVDAAAARGEVVLGWRRVRLRSRDDLHDGVILNPALGHHSGRHADDRLIVLAPAPPVPSTPPTRATLAPAPTAVR